MGVDPNTAPPLPAPTETEVTLPVSHNSDYNSDASKPDDKSSYSLPEDGTPVTIKTRGHRAHRSQTSLLIEYFEGGKPDSSVSGDRKPDIRVRLIPSKKGNHDHIQITESKGTRKSSLTRKKISGATIAFKANNQTEPMHTEDAKSMSSFASATEESMASKTPLDIEIDRSGGYSRRSKSPLIPSLDGRSTYLPGNPSEISDIPADSFFDNSADTKQSDYGSRRGSLVPAALGDGASAVLSDKTHATRNRSESRDASLKSKDKSDRRQHRSSKSKSEILDMPRATNTPRRRMSRSNSDANSPLINPNANTPYLPQESRPYDQNSVISAASKSSINNPKLLETVEDAIRRLILPELDALKREQSKRESRRDSPMSSTTSISHETALHDSKKKQSDKAVSGKDTGKRKARRDREARHDYEATSPTGFDASHNKGTLKGNDSSYTTVYADDRYSNPGNTVKGSTVVSVPNSTASTTERKQRRRRRTEQSRNRAMGQDDVSQDGLGLHDDYMSPPLPLMSEINPSEVTRTSILSAATDRPISATEEKTPVQEVRRGVELMDSPPTPVLSPESFQHTLGTKHANVSHGDLNALARRRTGEYQSTTTDAQEASRSVISPHQSEEYDEDDYDRYEEHYGDEDFRHECLYPHSYEHKQHVLSPIQSEAEDPSEVNDSDSRRMSQVSYQDSDFNVSPSKLDNGDMSMLSRSSFVSNSFNRGADYISTPNNSNRSLNTGDRGLPTTMSQKDYDQKALNKVGANPNVINVPYGVESAVASLVDGSTFDQSVFSAVSAHPYSKSPIRDAIGKHSRDNTMSSTHSPSSSQDVGQKPWAKQYGLESQEAREHGVISPLRPNDSSHDQYPESPTESETRIATGALATLRARAVKNQAGNGNDALLNSHQYSREDLSHGQPTKALPADQGRLANTPTRSIDRFTNNQSPLMIANGIPDWHNPMPEPQYALGKGVQRQASFEAGDDWGGMQTPTRHSIMGSPHNEAYQPLSLNAKDTEDPTAVAAAGVMAALAAQSAQEPEESWQHRSDDRKRDTLLTNPYEDTSPVVNPALHENLIEARGFNDGYPADLSINSPVQRVFDEGYISQGHNRTPDTPRAPNVLIPGMSSLQGEEDPFYSSADRPYAVRHLSGHSHGMQSPIYDGATGLGMENIESRDVVALMQFLMARDAKKDAHEGALVQALIHTAVEMQSSFSDLKRLLAQTRDEIVTDVNDNTDKTVYKAINGPRPYPGSSPRSYQAASQAGTTSEELNMKKQSIFRRAMKGLSAKGTNDLGRIEDMLMQLLTEVDTLKSQTVRGNTTPGRPSFENGPAGSYEDRGYEPEGNAGTSTGSHGSQSGPLSLPQSRGPSIRQGYERKYSDHRISTVPEGNEDDLEPGQQGGRNLERQTTRPMTSNRSYEDTNQANISHSSNNNDDGTLSDSFNQNEQQFPSGTTTLSADNTPNKDKSKGRKSWVPRISRWSETTASSVGRVFRGSGTSKKRDVSYLNYPASMSDLDEDDYKEDDDQRQGSYRQDKLQSGFSESDIPSNSPQTAERIPPSPRTYMTPEDPKYKAHRNSINLQHPQPRQGQTERVRTALEFSAQDFAPTSPPRSEWGGSISSLNRFQPANNRYSDDSAAAIMRDADNWTMSSPTTDLGGPPRPPKEPLDNNPTSADRNYGRSGRVSKLKTATSPRPDDNADGAYSTNNIVRPYTGSPRLENRNLTAVGSPPARRPSGPRAMTPRSVEEDSPRDERKKKRDTFGTIASQISENNYTT